MFYRKTDMGPNYAYVVDLSVKEYTKYHYYEQTVVIKPGDLVLKISNFVYSDPEIEISQVSKDGAAAVFLHFKSGKIFGYFERFLEKI